MMGRQRRDQGKLFYEFRLGGGDRRPAAQWHALIEAVGGHWFTRHLDSIVARALLVAEFFNSIDPKRS